MSIREYDDPATMRPQASDLVDRDEDLDEDLDDDGTTCRYCNGSGVKWAGTDPHTGRDLDIPCPRCGGTGETWGWLA